MKPTVYLFDIDGTLLDGQGAGRVAMERALAGLYGSPEPLRTFSFAGMTDRAIVRRALSAIDPAPEPIEEAIDGVLHAYLEALPEAISATRGYALHDGVLEVLEVLEGAPEIAMGLGTGNVRRGALLKLEPLGVAERFSFGGFGCDAEDRAALLRRGAERGAAALGRGVDACRVVVIGDTPHDVSAALAIGAECLGVGTSFFSAPALLALGAHAAVESLRAPRTLPFLLGTAR